jgi:hypothetical protein
MIMPDVWNLVAQNRSDDSFDDEIQKAIEYAGYAYDESQDIFYSTLDPWQKRFGYCALFDESAAPMGMILDFEPIRFYYGGRNWLIELWKGQYDLTTGSEIGVYNTIFPNINIPGFFNGTYYNAAHEEDYLDMSYTLKKKGVPLFRREDRHWWLTGFRVGEFSHRHDLTMDVHIELENHEMRDAFVNALLKLRYTEMNVIGNSVYLEFDKPHSHQPMTRTLLTDWLIQMKNKQLCNIYNGVTKDCVTMQERMYLLKTKYPQLFYHVINIGKTRKFFDLFDTLLVYFH